MSSLSCLFHLGSVIPSFSSVSSFFIFNIFLIHFALITLFLSFFSHPVSPICMFISLATVVISLTPTSPQVYPNFYGDDKRYPGQEPSHKGEFFCSIQIQNIFQVILLDMFLHGAACYRSFLLLVSSPSSCSGETFTQ